MLPSRVNVSVEGDHSSAVRMALPVSVAAVLGPPPVTRTFPSGSEVSVWEARAKVRPGTCRQVGDGCVRSSTYAVATDVRRVRSGSTEVPLLRNFQGWYMSELPPSTAGPPTAVQECRVASSIWLTMGSRPAEGTKTRPSGSTKTCG